MKIACDVIYLKQVSDDLDKLPDKEFEECMMMIGRLENNIHLGKPLEDKNGKNLSGFFKIYFCNARYRIVYRKILDNCEIVGIEEVPKPIAEIIAIGKREGQQVYNDADNRINNFEPTL